MKEMSKAVYKYYNVEFSQKKVCNLSQIKGNFSQKLNINLLSI